MALNFPTANLQVGVTQYTSDLGTTYIWDGVKWVGRSAGGAVGTNSIQNSGYTVQVDSGGNLVLPEYSLPNTVGTEAQVLAWPADGTVLEWVDQNGGGNVDLGKFKIIDAGSSVGLTTTDDADGYGGYGMFLSPDGEGDSYITIPNNAEAATGEYLRIGATEANSAVRIETDGGDWTFDATGNLVLPNNQIINASAADVLTVGTANARLYLDSEFQVAKITAKKTFSRNFELDIAGVEAFTYTSGSVAVRFMANDGLYFRQLLSRLVDYFDGLGIVENDYSNVRLTINPNTANLQSTVTDVSSNGNNPPTYTITLGTAHAGPITITEVDISYDYNNTIGLDVDSDYYGMATDNDDIDIRSGRDINLRAADDVLMTAGGDLEIELSSNDGRSLTSGIDLRTRTNAGSKTWTFRFDGNLSLPLGGNILNNDGSVYGGGGGNANTGNFIFDADTITNDNGLILATDRGTLAIGTNMEGPGVAGHFHIAFDGSNVNPPANDLFLGDDYNYVKLPGSALNPYTPYGIEIGTHNNVLGGDTHNWRFETDGNLVLPQGSRISDQATSVDLVVGRTSDNPYWYNIFGDTGATNSANITINGSVVRDTGGNVYAIGSLIHGDGSFDADNLFLKYSPLGELLWRRTWTDNNGLNCGSYNATIRYVEANVDLDTQDTIVWAAHVPVGEISYVGTMDTEGNMVDQFGVARLSTRLDNVKVTDLEWVGNTGGMGVYLNSIVGVVGQYYDPGPGNYIPFFGAIDLDTAQFIGNITVTPAGSDQTNAGGPLGIPYTNTFKAIAAPTASSSAFVGTYYDSTYSHAMLAFSDDDPTTTIGIGVDSNGTDNISGEDLCCDANGNVYVIVNNITSNYSVLIKSDINNLATGNSFWQKQLGFDYPAGDSFRATTVAYDNGYVYVLGQYYDDSTGDTDAMIIKVGIGNGNVVWQRRIGSPGDDGVSFYGPDGWESSSGITVQDGLIAVSFATEARTPGLGGGAEYNTVTLQYPVDGSILGTFGDFVISDFDVGNTDTNYSITTLTTTLGNVNLTSGFATLNPTVQTVGTGWTNTQWDLENNIQIFGSQTFKFMTDGTFDTAEIKHQGEVRITANTTVANATPSTWTFQNNDGLQFPDGSVQYGAYIDTEIALDGGSAGTVFNILPRPPVADGGGSSSRFGVNDPVYDGNSVNNYVLDGGGA
jgi:hypothetical protein